MVTNVISILDNHSPSYKLYNYVRRDTTQRYPNWHYSMMLVVWKCILQDILLHQWPSWAQLVELSTNSLQGTSKSTAFRKSLPLQAGNLDVVTKNKSLLSNSQTLKFLRIGLWPKIENDWCSEFWVCVFHLKAVRYRENPTKWICAWTTENYQIYTGLSHASKISMFDWKMF